GEGGRGRAVGGGPPSPRRTTAAVCRDARPHPRTGEVTMTRNARTRTLAVTIVLALLAFAGTTRAHEITRRTFTFLGERLTITLTVDAPGTLRVIRGEARRLEVIARAEDGFVDAGLAARPPDELCPPAPRAARAATSGRA